MTLTVERNAGDAIFARLEADAGAALAPRTETAMSVALVADVSGFTALTASLEKRHGGRGADMLSAIMDRLLGALAEIAADHGGLVVDVIGDAIHALWIAENDAALDDARTASVAAARAMLAFAERTADDRDETPVRIGIASGKTDLAAVGGVGGRWERLAYGPAFFAAGEAVGRVPKSWCLIGGHPAWQAVAEAEGGEPEHPGWWLLKGDETATGGAVRSQTVDAMAWTAELRLVTVMFCRLVKADEMASVDAGRIHMLTRAAQEVVGLHGGLVDRVHADEKGVSMVVAFGIGTGSGTGTTAAPGVEPGIGGGSALHCVLAALDLKRALSETGVEPAIGIATGKVRVGVGANMRGSSHTLYGNAVNFAARCMQAARDEILCDAATHDGAAQAVRFFAPEARQLKGLDDGGHVYGVGGLREEREALGSAETAKIAGRADERARIAAFLEDREAVRARSLVIEGEQGVGKSRLAAFAAEHAAELGMAPIFCRAGLLGTRTPLFAWRDQMATLLTRYAQALEITADAARLRLAGGEPAQAMALAPLFGAGGETDEAGDPQEARKLRAAVAAELIGDGPRLVVIGDAHWIDDTSLHLARDLLRALPDLQLLFVTRRPVPAGILKVTPGTIHMQLGNLDRGEVAELAAGMLGPFDPKHPFVDWLHMRSAGNPMFARALIELLPGDIMAGALSAPGAWRDAQARIERTDIPATIEGALLARFGNLPPTQLGILKAASVASTIFGPRLLTALGTPATAEEIDRDLDALTAAGILARAEDSTRPGWRFADELTREVIYNSLPRQLLKELHRRAAEYLASGAGRKGSGEAAQIAQHWLAADEPERAVSPLYRAGKEAQRVGAYAAAVSLWNNALTLIETGKAGARGNGRLRGAILHRDLAFAHGRLGEHSATIAHCYASLENLWPGAPTTPNGWRWALGREIAQLAWHVATARFRSRKRRGVEGRMRDWLRLSNSARLIEALYFTEGTLPTAAVAVYSARVSERIGNRTYAARPYGHLGYLAGSAGYDRIAAFCFNRPRADCIAQHDWSSLSQSVHGETMFLLGQGRWADGIRRARFGGLLSRKLARHAADVGTTTTLIGLGHLMAGDFAAMRESFEAVEAAAYAKTNDHYLVFAREGLGQAELALGKAAKAEPLLAAALDLSRRTRDQQSALIAAALLLNAKIALGRIEEAIEAAPAVLAQGEATPMVNFGTWYGFGALAEAMLAIYANKGGGAHKTAAARAVALIGRFAKTYPVGAPRALLCAGQLAALSGDHAQAAKHWQRGLKRAEAKAMRHDLARLHAALGRCPAVAHDEAVRHRTRANALAAECGVPVPLTAF